MGTILQASSALEYMVPLQEHPQQLPTGMPDPLGERQSPDRVYHPPPGDLAPPSPSLRQAPGPTRGRPHGQASHTAPPHSGLPMGAR
eukprot:12605691-Heterocapsa_arctica.AAC.1